MVSIDLATRRARRESLEIAIAKVAPHWDSDIIVGWAVLETGNFRYIPRDSNRESFNHWGIKRLKRKIPYVRVKTSSEGWVNYCAYKNYYHAVEELLGVVDRVYPDALPYIKDYEKFFAIVSKKWCPFDPEYENKVTKIIAKIKERKEQEREEVITVAESASTKDVVKATGIRAARAGAAAIVGVVVAAVPEVASSIGDWALALIPALMAIGKLIRVKFPKISSWVPV